MATFNGTNNNEILTGSDQEDQIFGNNGDDTLDGGQGNDTLTGGNGRDTYLFRIGSGKDIIDDYNSNNDALQFENIATKDLDISISGSNLVIKYGNNDKVTLLNQFIGGVTYTREQLVNQYSITSTNPTPNPNPTTFSGNTEGNVTEDNVVSDNGTLSVTDLDAGDATIIAQASTTGIYGRFSIGINGVWNYTLNNSADNVQALKSDQVVNDTFVVTTAGGATQSINIRVTGVNDAPTLDSPTAASYIDTAANDTYNPTRGTLVGHDVDADTTLTYGIEGGTVVNGFSLKMGTYGALLVNTLTGDYTFTPNDSSIESLKTGENPIESFTVTVSDEITTTHAAFNVDLTGANETPPVPTPTPVPNPSPSGISDELFLAILSLDTYYRGTTAEGEKINVIPGNGVGTASFNYNYMPSQGLPSWNSVGFAATVYSYDGKQVIAFRGTDNIGLDIGSFFNGGDLISKNSDVLNGWTLMAGYYPAPQALLAIDLYQQVVGRPISEGGSSLVMLTGHSLGGALAGYLSMLTGSQAIGYDNIPFRLAGTLKMTVDAINEIIDIVGNAFKNGININDADQRNTLLTQITSIKLPDYSAFKGIYVDEEAAQYLRDAYAAVIPFIANKLKDVFQEIFNNKVTDFSGISKESLDFIYKGIGDLFKVTGIDIPSFDDIVNKINFLDENANHTKLDNYGWDPAKFEALKIILQTLEPIGGILKDVSKVFGESNFKILSKTLGYTAKGYDLALDIIGLLNNTIGRAFDASAKHSISTLVALQFAGDHENEYSHWNAGIDLKLGALPDLALSALNSAAIGEMALPNSGYLLFNNQAMNKAGGLLSVAIDYSALENGTLPFGNTGIWAFFNDLNDLGEVLAGDNVNKLLKDEPFNFFGLFDREKINTGFTQALIFIVTQYAGALAFNAVKEEDDKNVKSRDGVLGLSDDKSDLALDLSDVLWKDVLTSGSYTGSDQLSITSQSQVLISFFSRSEETGNWLFSQKIDEQALNQVASEGWHASSFKIMDRLHIATKNNPGTVTMSERAYSINENATGDQTHVDVYIGTDKADTVYGTSGNDFILTGDGNDEVHSGLGKDFIISGNGNDHIYDDLYLTNSKGQSQNDDDVYVGEKIDKNMIDRFWEVLAKLNVINSETDVVEYAVIDPKNPTVTGKKGVSVDNISLGKLGELEAKAHHHG